MEQYIPKSVVLTEIDRRIQFFTEESGNSNSDIVIALFGLKSFLDTFEVKEVDLEAELIKWHKEHFKKDGTFIKMSGFYLTNNSQMDIAKHFFELGVAVSNEAQKGEEV